MKSAFVASPTDVGLLTSSILRDLTPEPIDISGSWCDTYTSIR